MISVKLLKLLTSIGLAISTVGFAHAGESIKVGISSGPSKQVLEVAKKLAKEKYDLDIKVITFDNYFLPNEALNSGEIDANIFQTRSFLKKYVSNTKYKIVEVGQTFIYPMGIYSRNIKKLSEIGKDSKIIIPSDPSNQGRALILLKNAGLIKLKEGVGETPTPKDITENHKKIIIQTVDAAQVARSVEDVTAVVLNNDFVLNAKFKPSDALFRENPESAETYVNIIVVKESEKGKRVFKELREVMNSDAVLKETEKLFPGAVKAWK
ncbi:MetQ/NlpA family ABC transporter substrate-binding protein [Fluviispira multicolorata]|uniref:Lipoprotein n=1 Tax=Fluviispira multicolorata TaxID=2654512 RepID=A0A833JBF0_9BACT|nr:MetQ/NlpA family ABC transporter substrate-binding protein [Fluviispira multicolorata]KAB8028524.1 MetQ/NlpA family lipoprotein [Fluviispira multicolorata]